MVKTDVLIIGGGPAGISSAIWCSRLGLHYILIESKAQLGGQLHDIQNEIIDYPGIIANNGNELNQLFVNHLNKLHGSYRLNTHVLTIDALNQSVALSNPNHKSHEIIQYGALILATGSTSKTLEIPGELEMIQRGEIYSASRDREKFPSGTPVAVVGGGDRAFEGALLLAEQGVFVHLIHRSVFFRAREEFQEAVLSHPNIKLHTNTIITEILGTSKVTGIKVLHQNREESMPVEAVFVRIGVKPNSTLLQGQVDMDHDGYILVDSLGQTNVNTIYAIGDVCTRPLYSSIATGVGQGMVAAKQVSLSFNHKLE